MSFTVLTDTNVREVLHSLNPTDASRLATSLEDAFIKYSCKSDSEYQPERSVVSRPTGEVSLFMPATTPQNIGVKIVGISSPTPSNDASTGQKPAAGLKSILTLCDNNGTPVGVLNAAELTGFRTALGSMLLYRLRERTENVVVFGAGKQAEWHIRLASLLKGSDIGKITIVNRNRDRTKELMKRLREGESAVPESIGIKEFEGDASDAALEKLLVEADVIFFTTASKAPLFPAKYLLSEQALKKTRYLAAIGSFQLDMAEIDPDLITTIGIAGSPLAEQGWKGQIVVDSREACLHEAGEFVKSGLKPENWMDVGRVVEYLRQGDHFQEGGALKSWLESGFVIYKSVGVGIMDIAIGNALLGLAKDKGVGISVANF